MNPISALIILSGAILGLSLSLWVAGSEGLKRREYLFYTGFIFFLSLNNLLNYLYEAKSISLLPFTALPPTITIPTLGYFYVLELLRPSFNITIKEKGIFLLLFSELILYASLIIIKMVNAQFLMNHISFISRLLELKELMSIFLSAVLNLDIFFQLYNNKKNKQFAPANIKWSKIFFIVSIMATISWVMLIIYSFVQQGTSRKIYYPIWYFSSLLIVCCAAYTLWKKFARSAPGDSSLKMNLGDEKNFQGLEDIMIREKLYKNPKLTVKEFADQCNISVVKVSGLLKANGENFSAFLNRHRVEEAKRLLAEEAYLKYSMEAICEGAGFNSRATFFQVFKDSVGKTPKQYRDELTNKLEASSMKKLSEISLKNMN